MSIMSAILVYAVIWTVVIFIVLSLGIRVPENADEGHASSAPANPRISEKILITSLVSAILWALACWFLTSEYARL
jgi:predicted secreted protein